jgi:hypothetical protein
LKHNGENAKSAVRKCGKTGNNAADGFHDSDFLMSVNGHICAICNHCDVLAFENGTLIVGKVKSAVRWHPTPELYR